MVNERIQDFNPLLEHWDRKDWFCFFILVPTTLFLIFCLPIGFRQHFILDLQNPTLFSIFANHYTHSELSHLGNNLGMYLLAMFTIFNIETDKGRFYRVMTSLFLIMPFLSSFLIVKFVSNLPPLQGFSAIGSGLVGYILYAVYSYLKQKSDSVKPLLFSLILMVNFLMLVIINNYGTMYVSIIGLVLIVLLAISYKDIFGLVDVGRTYFKHRSKGIDLEFIYLSFVFAICLILSFALPFIVPSVIVNNGTITNILSHYFGWAWGFSIPWFLIGFSVIFGHNNNE